MARKPTPRRAKRRSPKPRPAVPSKTTWPTRRAAAVELSELLGERISEGTIAKRWAGDSTCPLPPGRQPIPKAPLIAWAKTVRRVPGSGRTIEDQEGLSESAQKTIELEVAKLAGQVRNLELKNSKLGELVLNVEDVRLACVESGAELQRQLLEDVPQACALAGVGKPLLEATVAVREVLRGVCERYAAALEKMARGGE
jgi:hypothetical protein